MAERERERSATGRPTSSSLGGGRHRARLRLARGRAGLERRRPRRRRGRSARREVAAGMIAPVGEASWGEDALLAAALASAGRWPGFARELAEAERRARSPTGAAARCTSRSTATRRPSCAAGTSCTSELGLEARVAARAASAGGSSRGSRRSSPAAIEAPGEAEVDPRALLRGAARGAARRGGAVRRGRRWPRRR